VSATRAVASAERKPMAIEWELAREMPPALYQEIKVAAG
jgi:hypothetical protein